MNARADEDPLEEVRRMKIRASAPFGHDVRRYGEHLMNLPAQSEGRLSPAAGDKKAGRPTA